MAEKNVQIHIHFALEMIKKRRSPGVLRLYVGKNVFYEQNKKRELPLIKLIWKLFSKHFSILKQKYYLVMFIERVLFCLKLLVPSTTSKQTITVNFRQK